MFIQDIFEPVGTTFDDQAPRNILDMNTTLPYAQLNQPEGENPPPNTPVSALSDFFPNNGTATASQLSGDWKLNFVDFVAPTGTTAPVQFVVRLVAQLYRRDDVRGAEDSGGAWGGGGGGITSLVASNSDPSDAPATTSHTGRRHPPQLPPTTRSGHSASSRVAFTWPIPAWVNASGTSSSDPNPNDTDIYLLTSDNAGQSWQFASRVNDDSQNDGFSAGNRPQFEPQVAVDQSTGTVVISFFDERYDAAQARPRCLLARASMGERRFLRRLSSTRP